MKPLLLNTAIIQRYQDHQRQQESSQHRHKPHVFRGIRNFFHNLSIPLCSEVGFRKCRNTDSMVFLVDRDYELNKKGKKYRNQKNKDGDSGSAAHQQFQSLEVKNTEELSAKLSKKQKLQQIVDLFSQKGYHLGQVIGEGSYASVRVVQRKYDGQILAAKIVDKVKRERYAQKFLPKEMAAGLKFNHRNIVNYWELIILSNWAFIIMDFAELGDLLNLIKQYGPIRNQRAKEMFKQMTLAVHYLHQQGFVHRDLKCENILLRKDMSIFIGDFGFSRQINKDGGTVSKTFCGSAAYSSPELLQGFPYDPVMNDVWSLGCILYVVITGLMPFDETDLKAMVRKQLKQSIAVPVNDMLVVSADCQELIHNLLNPYPTERIKLEEVLSCNWFCTEEVQVFNHNDEQLSDTALLNKLG